MQIQAKTIEKLREVINGDTLPEAHYRGGPKLVAFFNELGFNDVYRQGFPSRWVYTEEKLKTINGTPELDKCIRKAFAVVDFVNEISLLDQLIADFNKYLAFDRWQVVRDNDTITFKKVDKVVVQKTGREENGEAISREAFLGAKFNANIDALKLEGAILEILKGRLAEIETCVRSKVPLAAVILIGSVLEGLLLGVATSFAQEFNKSACAPKDNEGKVKKFQDWKLREFIDVATGLGVLKIDVQKFSHAVREFRNYIHPYQQLSTRFQPSQETAEICFQVLKAAVSQICDYQNRK